MLIDGRVVLCWPHMLAKPMDGTWGVRERALWCGRAWEGPQICMRNFPMWIQYWASSRVSKIEYQKCGGTNGKGLAYLDARKKPQVKFQVQKCRTRQARKAFGHHGQQNSSCNHCRRVAERVLYGLWTRNLSWTLTLLTLWPRRRCFQQSQDCRDRILSRCVDQNSGGSKPHPLDELNLTIVVEGRLAWWWRVDLRNFS